MKKFFIFFLLYIFNIHCSLSVSIKEDTTFYYVNNVKVEDIATGNYDSVKTTALKAVKQKALTDLMNYMKKDTPINDVNLDGAISSFKIIDENYDNDFYSIIADFTFNKNVINSMFSGVEKFNKNKNIRLVDGVVALYEKNNLVKEYVRFRDYLKKNKITYSTEYITNKEIRVRIYKIDEDTIYYKLKELDLNGKMYLDTL